MEPRESEDPRATAFTGGGVENAAKGGRDFPGAFECHQTTVRGGQEGQLVAGTGLITLVHLVT